MPERIACLMPTYNRASTARGRQLLREAVGAFAAQEWPAEEATAELIIGNDTPGQRLLCDVPGVRIINYPRRLSSLGGKLSAMIEVAAETGATMLMRWDDDDISLPNRFATSLIKMRDRLEWRPSNYWFFQAGRPGEVRESLNAGNGHVMAAWRPELLSMIGGYPDRTGDEDQAFDQAVAAAGVSPLRSVDRLTVERIFYVYRWGVSAHHLSGRGGSVGELQAHWQAIGSEPIEGGTFGITPAPWGLGDRDRIVAAAK